MDLWDHCLDLDSRLSIFMMMEKSIERLGNCQLEDKGSIRNDLS